MADVTITYKGSTLATMDASGSKTLKTEGKYCEDDIEVEYVKPSGGGGFVVTETPDVHGGTILDITGVEYVAVHGSATPSETAQTITPPAGKLFDEFDVGAIPSNYVGSGVTRKAAATYTPSRQAQTIPAGQYLDGAQTIDPIPSEYVVPNGTKTITENGTGIDVSQYESVDVDVPTGPAKNVQAYRGYGTVNSTSYTATDVTITVAKTGTYNVSWMGWRNRNSGTHGSQLYKNGTAVGNANTTFQNTYGQYVSLTNLSLQQGDVLVIRARASSTSYVTGVGNLIIEEV